VISDREKNRGIDCAFLLLEKCFLLFWHYKMNKEIKKEKKYKLAAFLLKRIQKKGGIFAAHF